MNSIDERYLSSYDMNAEMARFAGNWKSFGSFGWHDRPDDADQWTIVYTKNRDSSIHEESNADVIAEELKEYLQADEPDIIAEHHGHWAVGWVDGYSIRVSRNGEPTEAFRKWLELQARIEEYPCLDETDVCNREYEATLKNIEDNAKRFCRDDLPEDWVGQVYSWLSENDSGALEGDDGGYPSEDELRPALEALGFLEFEEN